MAQALRSSNGEVAPSEPPVPLAPTEPPPDAVRRVTPIAGPGPEIVRPALGGLVPYEPGKPVETVQRELGLDRVVKLASNEGPFGPFPAAIEAIERALGESNRYPDGGCYRLARRSPTGTASRSAR